MASQNEFPPNMSNSSEIQTERVVLCKKKPAKQRKPNYSRIMARYEDFNFLDNDINRDLAVQDNNKLKEEGKPPGNKKPNLELNYILKEGLCNFIEYMVKTTTKVLHKLTKVDYKVPPPYILAHDLYCLALIYKDNTEITDCILKFRSYLDDHIMTDIRKKLNKKFIMDVKKVSDTLACGIKLLECLKESSEDIQDWFKALQKVIDEFVLEDYCNLENYTAVDGVIIDD